MCESSDESVSELSILADSGSDEWVPSDLDLPSYSGTSVTRLGSVNVDSNSDSEKQQVNCADNLTQTTTITNSSEVFKERDLTETTLKKNSNKKNIVKSTLLSPINSESENISCVTEDSFFIPPEICELYSCLKEHPRTIFEYYFDSSSSEEDTCGSELKSSGSVNDSQLYSFLLRLKKRKSSVWKSKCKKYSKNFKPKNKIYRSFHIQKPKSVILSDKGIERSSSDQYGFDYTDRSCINKSLSYDNKNLVENESSVKVVNVDQQKSKNNTNSLVISLLEHPCRTENKSGHILDNISPTQIVDYVDEKCENTSDIKTQIIDNSTKKDKNNSLFLESSKFDDIFSDSWNNCSENKSTIDKIACDFGALSDEEIMGKFKGGHNPERSSNDGPLKNTEFSFKLYKPGISTVVKHQSSIENDKTNARVSVTDIKPRVSVRAIDNGQHEQRSIHDISSDDSDLEKHITSVLSVNKEKDSGEHSFGGNYQKDLNRTSEGYVIKLSSDSESDSNPSSKSARKTPMTPSVTNRPLNRLVSECSNNYNPDISNSKISPSTSFEMDHSNSQNNNEFLIDFNEDFYKENEIWLLKFPMSINMSNIREQSLNMLNRTVVHDRGRKYECYINPTDSSLQSANLALPTKNDKFSLNVVPITGSITLEEIVDVPKVTSVTVKPKRKLAVPDNLKVRHPLLCLDYHDQPKIPVIDNDCYDQGKKKLKKIDIVEIDSKEKEAVFNSVPSKKRKRKSEHELSSVFNSDENEIEIQSSPVKKKMKEESDTILVPDADTTDSSINNLSWSKKKKKKRSKDELLEVEEETQYVEKSSSRKKKKDKKKHKSV